MLSGEDITDNITELREFLLAYLGVSLTKKYPVIHRLHVQTTETRIWQCAIVQKKELLRIRY